MLDLGELEAALAAHGRVARVVIAAVEGSAPREVGAAMLVWEGGQAGTIGGGALEFRAAERARGMLAGAMPAGGPPPHSSATGGGLPRLSSAVRPLTACPPPPLWGREGVGGPWGRCRAGAFGPGAGAVLRRCGDAVGRGAGPAARAGGGRGGAGAGGDAFGGEADAGGGAGAGVRPDMALVQGWLVEPVAVAERQVWIWGAGHVGARWSRSLRRCRGWRSPGSTRGRSGFRPGCLRA